MTDAQRLAEIKERTEKATKGPWEWSIFDESMAGLMGPDGEFDHVLSCGPCKSCQKTLKENKDKKFFGSCTVPQEPDAMFIAHSRDDIDFLLEKISEKDARIQELEANEQKFLDHGINIEKRYVEKVGALEKECKRLSDFALRVRNAECVTSGCGKRLDDHECPHIVKELKERIAGLEGALEYYAKNAVRMVDEGVGRDEPIDDGEIARQALQGKADAK